MSFLCLGGVWERESTNDEVALALAAGDYDIMHTYLETEDEAERVVAASGEAKTGLYELLKELRMEKRLEGVEFNASASAENVKKLLTEKDTMVREKWKRWDVMDCGGMLLSRCSYIWLNGIDWCLDLKAAHRELSKLATQLFVATREDGFDFYVCHLLTVSWAVRVLIPELPEKFARKLVSGLWLLIIVVYCFIGRPELNLELAEKVDVDRKSWDMIVKKALEKKVPDTHYLKGKMIILW